ncbi:MAG: hypothetical protein A3H50_03210 [Candidatus Levybacteria bacterium RIFCSPLOWO2_02_FULL_37_10]|nr:MAG: hypothetical protein A2860_00880 [Candidatus Levybacteria bacterium RIFCSPHIGHO2_01_FULL_37_33]OGH16320.1 MAG: hypothetical protein A3C97_03185 [Candidatus Levybacteria bacterium RIFCSPHIGHO2_02_FULL_37_11]OGH29371.1 MAG: hypothetical protein A3F30_01100 [Candidatus Levybacteria bacterium RIFCSPHIGHO2_12_FULL_37_12]OGH32552.1 MAG: hypothetical protein A2953_00320 [Candidatus Levybacteria bacterium RIFCSPLOWO2_01_FULL_36_54]OGH43410.1 MAG: hypothetical protein A3H50_03210 [Candidatus Lev
MKNTAEAIEFTRDLARSAYETDPSDPYFDFMTEVVAKNISMQAKHLENASRAMVSQAEQLKVDVESKLQNGQDR